MSVQLKKSFVILLVSLLTLTNNVYADNISGADKKRQEVNVSLRERNILSIDGRKVSTVVPSIREAITGVPDPDSGVLYFTVNSPDPVTLFVTDDQYVLYQVLIKPVNMGPATLTLTPGFVSGQKGEGADFASEKRAMSYQRHIKDLMLSMADSETDDASIDATEVHQQIPLWKEGTLILEKRYVDGDMVGEKYTLQNTSGTDMKISEPELLRKGVLGVAISNHSLESGQRTTLFIVRERKDNE